MYEETKIELDKNNQEINKYKTRLDEINITLMELRVSFTNCY